MGVEFGTEEATEGPVLRAKFHPHRCNDKDVGPQKLKFVLRFDRNVEYKRPAGAYPLRDFTKFAISKACYYHIRQLRCIRPYLDSNTDCTIATSIVHSKLDYCNSLYYNLPKS